MSWRTFTVPGVALLLLSACAAQPTPSPSAVEHAEHNPQTRRVIAALEDQFGVVFQPAGPHHELGQAPSGVELDLIGVPVEEVILSVPASDPEAGQAYLPHLRDLLHGPGRVYDWAAAMLACRADPTRTCEERFEQGNVAARFSDGGPDFVVVSISRAP